MQYKYVIRNEGIGPALIEKVIIKYGENKTYDDFIDYVDDVISERDSVWYLHSNLTTGRLIPAQDEIALIMIINDNILKELGYNDEAGQIVNTMEGSALLYETLNHDSLDIEVVYKSIYGETWSITNSSRIPLKH